MFPSWPNRCLIKKISDLILILANTKTLVDCTIKPIFFAEGQNLSTNHWYFKPQFTTIYINSFHTQMVQFKKLISFYLQQIDFS